jgi:hypothetical protein
MKNYRSEYHRSVFFALRATKRQRWRDSHLIISIPVRARLCTRFTAIRIENHWLSGSPTSQSVDVHQELSIRGVWISFFRTQGDQAATLERFPCHYLDPCARPPLHKIRSNKKLIMVNSGTCLLRNHQEFSIRVLWISFFRTQGDQAATLERFPSHHLHPCARPPLHKNRSLSSLKLSSFFLFFQGFH